MVRRRDSWPFNLSSAPTVGNPCRPLQPESVSQSRPMPAARDRNNVKTFGRGQQAMIFAHGYGCDQNMWRFVAPAFADTHHIVLFDHVGNGKSDLSAYHEARYSTMDVCRQ